MNIQKKSPIPFYLITGFLGSGKTTLLKKIIDVYSLTQKIAIIQNEFAPGNSDGKELRMTEKPFRMLEINNGSVFCVCLLGSFISSLSKFIDEYFPDIVFLESSGLSDPVAIAEIMQHPEIQGKIYLHKVITVVDAYNVKKFKKFNRQIERQIKIADLIIINKTDLFEGNKDEIEEELKSINPFANRAFSSFCQISPAILLEQSGFSLANKLIDELKSIEQCSRPEINSGVFKTRRLIDEKAALELINTVAPQCYRLKGYFDLKNGKVLAIQSVAGKTDVKVIEIQQSGTEIIFISELLTASGFSETFKKFVSLQP